MALKQWCFVVSFITILYLERGKSKTSPSSLFFQLKFIVELYTWPSIASHLSPHSFHLRTASLVSKMQRKSAWTGPCGHVIMSPTPPISLGQNSKPYHFPEGVPPSNPSPISFVQNSPLPFPRGFPPSCTDPHLFSKAVLIRVKEPEAQTSLGLAILRTRRWLVKKIGGLKTRN